jgi:hypothetical protein
VFGILPGAAYGWPKNVLHWKGIDRSILDINSAVPVHFVIADGIIAMEGNGPLHGSARNLGRIVLSDDPVAADFTCAVNGIQSWTCFLSRPSRRVPRQWYDGTDSALGRELAKKRPALSQSCPSLRTCARTRCRLLTFASWPSPVDAWLARLFFIGRDRQLCTCATSGNSDSRRSKFFAIT